MDTTQLKSDLADDLREIQSFDTAAGAYLERCLFSAAKWLVRKKDWNFVLAQGTISAQDGTKGPYTLPADFDGLAGERRLTKYYAYDAAEVQPPVQDGNYNRRFEIYVDRSSGTPVLYFWLNPGTRSLLLTYRKKLATIADLVNWPEDDDLTQVLKKYASYLACTNTPELQGMGANFKALAEELLAEMWRAFRQKSSRADGRTPQDAFGQGLYQLYAGDYL